MFDKFLIILVLYKLPEDPYSENKNEHIIEIVGCKIKKKIQKIST